MNRPSSGTARVEPAAARWVLLIGLLAVAGELLLLYWRADAIPLLHDTAEAHWIGMAAPVNLEAQPRREQRIAFRRQIQITEPPGSLRLWLRAHRAATLYLDDVLIAHAPPAELAIVDLRVDLAPHLHRDGNVLTIMVANDRGPPLVRAAGDLAVLHTGPDWMASSDGRHWVAARTVAKSTRDDIRMTDGTPLQVLGSRWQQSLLWLLFGSLAALVFSGLSIVWQRRGVAGFRWALLIVLGLIFWHNVRRVPLHVGMDLDAHLDYLAFILERGALPLGTDGWQMFQPPLAYLLLAAVVTVGESLMSDVDVALTARVLTMAVTLSAAALGSRAVMQVMHGRVFGQLIGIGLTVLFPASIYMAHAFGNEPLFALLGSLLFYWIAVRMQGARRDALHHPIVLGVICGLALLSKTSAVILVALVTWLLVRNAGLGDAAGRRLGLRNLGVFGLTTALIGGWWYLRNLIALGRPFVGGWDPDRGMDWWQYPGYRLWHQLGSFGEVLVNPIMSGVSGFWDGLYSSLWGDGYLSGIVDPAYAPNWDYAAMLTLYPLALPLTLAVAAGLLRILGFGSVPRDRALFEASAIALLMFVGIMFHLYATVPIYSTAKGSYLIALAPAIGWLAAWGLDPLLDRRPGQVLIGGMLALWLGTVASAFIATAPA